MTDSLAARCMGGPVSKPAIADGRGVALEIGGRHDQRMTPDEQARSAVSNPFMQNIRENVGDDGYRADGEEVRTRVAFGRLD